MTDKRSISVTVNGTKYEREVPVRITLADFIRYDLGLTGTHLGCEHGVCGACTVQIDGRPARACLTLAVQADGATIRTVEGLAPAPDRMSVLQEAFRQHHALQCGFCTAGILMSLDALLRDRPSASEDQIRDVLSGHLCRCTGYAPIMKAALAAQKKLQEETHA